MKIAMLTTLSIFLGYLLTACAASGTQPKLIVVDETKNNDTVELDVGDQIEISLSGNLTTGYSWMLKSVDESILKPLGEVKYTTEDQTVGGGGRFSLQLKANTVGETWIEMAYRRSFEPETVPAVDEYKILVKVSD